MTLTEARHQQRVSRDAFRTHVRECPACSVGDICDPGWELAGAAATALSAARRLEYEQERTVHTTPTQTAFVWDS